jgi:hypothetical protein
MAVPHVRGYLITHSKPLKAAAKCGRRPASRAKNLAAGLAIPAARLNDNDGAKVACQVRSFNPVAIQLHNTDNKDGAGVSGNLDPITI